MRLELFYVIAKDSEADRAIAQYFADREADDATFKRIARRMGLPYGKSQKALKQGKTIVGFYLGEKPLPDNWRKVKGWSGYGFPKRRKEFKEVLKEVDALECPTCDGISEALFGDSPHLFTAKLQVIHGISYEKIGDRKVISFASEAHRELYDNNEKITWPKGLRAVKASTVVKWQEQQANP